MSPPLQHQRGLSLLLVVTVMLLTLLLTIGAARTAWLHALALGNDADYQRSFEAAQAMLQDAELDILGLNAAGGVCVPDPRNDRICRRNTSVWFIDEDKDLVQLLATLEGQPGVACLQGICAKFTDPQDFWNDAQRFDHMRAANVAARYGEFTGAQTGPHSNPLLRGSTTGAGAWYWVEVMPHAANTAASGAAQLALHLKPRLVYRITAIAQGRKPGTLVVLQTTFARHQHKD